MDDNILWPRYSAYGQARDTSKLRLDCTNGWILCQMPLCFTGGFCRPIWAGKMKRPSRRLFLIMREFRSTLIHYLIMADKRSCPLRPFSASCRRLASYRHPECQLQNSRSSLLWLQMVNERHNNCFSHDATAFTCRNLYSLTLVQICCLVWKQFI